MNTSIACLALASLLGVSSHAEVPTWSTDYYQAKQQGKTQQKPMAVVFSSGVEGQTKVCREGSLSAEAQKLLADKYQCVYVDMATPAGKQLAGDFGISANQGLVLSNREGNFQAFHHNGDLPATDLTRALERFSDPNLVVNSTVTDLNSRVSYYPPSYDSAGQPIGVQYFQSYGSSYCPNCRR